MNRPESGGDDLATAVARESLPTPSARGWKSGAASDATHDRNARPLNEFVQRFPSPQSSDYREKKTSAKWEAAGALNYSLANPKVISTTHGSLSPAWVERLMQWPDGWSAPGPLAPDALARWLSTDWRAAWSDGSWEAGVPRVAVGVKHRVARLKALGNGWVPVQAALAIRRLVATLEALPRSGGADLLEGP